jgi:hypothetical protein
MKRSGHDRREVIGETSIAMELMARVATEEMA